MEQRSRVEQFKALLLELATVRNEIVDVEDLAASNAHEWIAPLKDGSVDPGDLETIAASWWRNFKAQEIEAARKEIRIQARLAALYGYLESASDAEIEEYAHAVSDARFQDSPWLRRLAETFRNRPPES